MFFGDMLRTLRLAKGLEQKHMAVTLEVHPSFISHLERGKKLAPMSDVFFQRIATALQLSSDEKARLVAAAEDDLILGKFAEGLNLHQATLGVNLIRNITTLSPAKIDAIYAVLRA